jgi:hypothetical protein
VRLELGLERGNRVPECREVLYLRLPRWTHTDTNTHYLLQAITWDQHSESSYLCTHKESTYDRSDEVLTTPATFYCPIKSGAFISCNNLLVGHELMIHFKLHTRKKYRQLNITLCQTTMFRKNITTDWIVLQNFSDSNCHHVSPSA